MINNIFLKGYRVQKIFGFLFILLSAGVAVWYPLGKLLGS